MTTFGLKRFPYAPGNCLSACVASILEMPIDQVPHFVERHDSRDYLWMGRLNSWLSRLGLCASYLEPGSCDMTPDFHILYGLSVLGNEHAVVGHAGRVIHDPHPSRTGLASVTGVICIEPCSGF